MHSNVLPPSHYLAAAAAIIMLTIIIRVTVWQWRWLLLMKPYPPSVIGSVIRRGVGGGCK
jgi:hypothetical protein